MRRGVRRLHRRPTGGFELRVRKVGSITYSIKDHWNAKQVRLRVTPERGVEVTRPKGFPLREIDKFVRSHREGIEEALEAYEEQRQDLAPDDVVLHAIGQKWTVTYNPESNSPGCSLHENGDELRISGDYENTDLLTEVLRMWLSGKGRQHLVPWLNTVSDELDLPYAMAIVRGQKTRWGSCSGRKTISLNRNLLFLDPSLARYVMVHELSHTEHLDHSVAFWNRLGELEPNYLSLDKATKSAHDLVPTWARME